MYEIGIIDIMLKKLLNNYIKKCVCNEHNSLTSKQVKMPLKSIFLSVEIQLINHFTILEASLSSILYKYRHVESSNLSV